eukprot:992354-Rhodomonas_salina.2
MRSIVVRPELSSLNTLMLKSMSVSCIAVNVAPCACVPCVCACVRGVLGGVGGGGGGLRAKLTSSEIDATLNMGEQAMSTGVCE